MRLVSNVVSNIKVGDRDVRPSLPTHSPGVREGNKRKAVMREPGIVLLGRLLAIATSRRSTGINAKARTPIDPRMPNLTPP